MTPLISICIPAYKNPLLLERLLDSILAQDFKDYEVICTDDTPNEEVEDVVNAYQARLSIQYFHNSPALGSPANWNKAISLAKGEWIKIMHCDDWFASDGALGVFVEVAKNKTADFIFSGYHLVNNTTLVKTHITTKRDIRKLKQNPLWLFKENFIGSPSTVMIKNNRETWYDTNLKWVVDFEFYYWMLKDGPFISIDAALINIGQGSHQITSQVFRDRAVEIPENIYMLNKLGVGILNNIVVYDYYWRVFRNLKIRSISEVEAHLGENGLPQRIIKLLNFQLKFKLKYLQVGVISKSLMLMSYITSK